jgi:hypothetical protein
MTRVAGGKDFGVCRQPTGDGALRGGTVRLQERCRASSFGGQVACRRTPEPYPVKILCRFADEVGFVFGEHDDGGMNAESLGQLLSSFFTDINPVIFERTDVFGVKSSLSAHAASGSLRPSLTSRAVPPE